VNVFGDIKLKPLKTIPLDFKDPFELFKKIYSKYSNTFLLESMESDSGLSRYSFLGFDPILTLTARDNFLEIKKDDFYEEIDTSNPFNEIRTLIGKGNNKKGFCGGLVGYVSYQAARFFHPVDLSPGNFPDYEFGLFLDGIIFDKLSSRCKYVTLAQNRVEEVLQAAKDDYSLEDKMSFRHDGQYFSQEKYEKMVRETKERIIEGEIFQSVISNSQKYKISGNKLCFYNTLRKMNPSPYMYHLKLDEREIIGSSPEMLVRVENKEIETFPIAGTRPRGENKNHDNQLASELLADKKEKAEHLMLVDLARNDVGRVSEYGTVNVPEYMNIKKFSHVQHILSRVTGTLNREKTSVDAFSSIFPAGTVSGAPKIRAMQIIEELEKQPRDAYAGALGYFSLNGNANFAITIRSMVCNGKNAKIQAGAGIVHDSIPENEFMECENKARALINSLKISGDSNDTDY
jgi:anthranilate synthase component 1